MIDAVLKLFGIQPDAYRALVRAFWRISLRSSSSLVMHRQGKRGSSLWKAWLLYALFGLLVSPLAFSDVPRPIFTAVVGMSAMFLIGMAVIADFAVMVMAPGDDEILFHRPVQSHTYLAARVTVAGMHVGVLALCYGFFPSLATLRYGEPLFAPMALIAVVAVSLLALLVTFWIYRIGLSWLGGARLQGMLTYAPALFSILTFLVPQLLIRGSLRGGALAAIEPILGFLPPAWFFAVPEVLLGDRADVMLRSAAIGVAILPIGYWILVRAMGRGFLDDLLRLLSTQGIASDAEPKRERPVPGASLARSTADLRAGYLLYAGAMRSRDSRTRSAPILLVPLALVLLGLVRPLSGGFHYGVMAIYLLAAGAGTLLSMAVFHEHHAAAWFYGAVPIRRYGQFFLGIVRGLLTRQILPAFLAAFVCVLVIDPSWGTALGMLHALAGGCLSIPFLGSFVKEPPFSHAFEAAEQTALMGVYFLSMLIVAATGVVHAVVALFVPLAFLITVPALALLCLLWMRAVARRLDEWPPEPVGAPPGLAPRAAVAGRANLHAVKRSYARRTRGTRAKRRATRRSP